MVSSLFSASSFPNSPGAEINLARAVWARVQAHHDPNHGAITARDGRGRVRIVSWRLLQQQVASLAVALKAMGLYPGDRVVAYLPHAPDSVVACLACASIGVVWSACPAEMGSADVLEYLRPLEPRALIAVDGVFEAGHPRDRSTVVQQLHAGLPSVVHLMVVRTPFASERVAGAIDFEALTERDHAATRAFVPEGLPPDHPLWMVPTRALPDTPDTKAYSHGEVLDWPLPHWHADHGLARWIAPIGALLRGDSVVLVDGPLSGTT